MKAPYVRKHGKSPLNPVREYASLSFRNAEAGSALAERGFGILAGTTIVRITPEQSEQILTMPCRVEPGYRGYRVAQEAIARYLMQPEPPCRLLTEGPTYQTSVKVSKEETLVHWRTDFTSANGSKVWKVDTRYLATLKKQARLCGVRKYYAIAVEAHLLFVDSETQAPIGAIMTIAD